MPPEENPFRTVFKHYKALPATQALAEAKEPSQPSSGLFTCVRLKRDACVMSHEKLQSLGLHPDIGSWNAFSVTSNDGLILIRGAITAAGQLYWAKLCLVDFVALSHRSNLGDLPCDPLQPKSKLRWATFGYHHDWDTKVYSDSWSPMPDEMIELGLAVGSTLGYPEYKAEASIVNYYMLNSTFCPHVDNSERNLDHPLISISLGQPCVFLIGGSTKETEPTALVLRSGDVLVMSGPSRLAYHAVPRIVKDVEFIDPSTAKSGADDPLILDYLNEHRINLNLRQVD
ncbi:putative alkylated DNA repair protein AlkB [Trichuris suis]|nr:putative alkylated DNA repair protein AlkB [Trichuris suis]